MSICLRLQFRKQNKKPGSPIKQITYPTGTYEQRNLYVEGKSIVICHSIPVKGDVTFFSFFSTVYFQNTVKIRLHVLK